MAKRESIARYSLIINKLRKHDSTSKEILDYLEFESELQDYDFNIVPRTLQRDIRDIRSLYNIDIQFDFSRKVYYINYDDQSEFSSRILEAFDTFNALNISDRLSDNIHFDKRRPQGTENLHGILHAVKNNHKIRFCYQKFDEDEPSIRQANPYALKEFKNRWYMLAKDLKDNRIKSFALDRLSNLDITRAKFDSNYDFDVNQHYKYCFGIISPNGKEPEEIELSFSPYQGKYIKTLQLHDTQKILTDNEQELKVSLKLVITKDLIMELLSHGENVKVIKPKSLINDIKNQLEKTIGFYK